MQNNRLKGSVHLSTNLYIVQCASLASSDTGGTDGEVGCSAGTPPVRTTSTFLERSSEFKIAVHDSDGFFVDFRPIKRRLNF